MELVRDLNGKLASYVWPGGYPLFYLDREDSVLCPKCANKSDNDEELPAFRPVVCDVNWEDTELLCMDCNEHIESAYGEN